MGVLLVFFTSNLFAWDTIVEAAGLGKVKEIQRFLDSGKSINSTDEEGMTPLMMAALSRKYTNMKFLIEHGANIKAKDNDGTTTLMGLCIGGTSKDIPIVKLLLSKGASLTTKDRDGNTAKELCKNFGTKIYTATMK